MDTEGTGIDGKGADGKEAGGIGAEGTGNGDATNAGSGNSGTGSGSGSGNNGSVNGNGSGSGNSGGRTGGAKGRRIEALGAIVDLINSTLDISVVLEMVMGHAMELMNAERGFIMLVDPLTYKLEFRVARNLDKKTLARPDLEISRTIVNQVFRTGCAMLTHNAVKDPRYENKPSVKAFGLRSVLCVPLIVKGKTVGAIYLDNRFKTGIFDDDDLEFMKVFSHDIALAMENARLEEEKKLIKDLFMHYVSPEVVEDILRRGPEFDLRGERREVTVFFLDIRGFTSLSEEKEPQELVPQLVDFRQEMVDVLFNYRGTLIKFLGDGTMGLFGAPLSYSDDPVRAVASGLEMLKESDRINELWEEEGRPALHIGIGMHCGPALVGNMGCYERREYDVIGDVPNTASRIESLNKEYGSSFLISGDLYEKVRHVYPCTFLGEVAIRGKKEPVPLYRVR